MSLLSPRRPASDGRAARAFVGSNPLASLASKSIGLFEALATPHGVDRYLELVNPMLTVRELRAVVIDVQHGSPDTTTLTLRPRRTSRSSTSTGPPCTGRRKWVVTDRGSGACVSSAIARSTGATAYPPLRFAPMLHGAANVAPHDPSERAVTAESVAKREPVTPSPRSR